ncbi:ArgS-related anticodon-binding protein NrtL [Streptomyces sp. NPDC002851]
MTPADVSRTVRRAVCRAVQGDALSVAVPERVVVERPRPGGRGDYATNVALQLAGRARRPAREVAELLTASLAAEPGIADVEITGPGFLNITLAGGRQGQQQALVREVLERAQAYGHGDGLRGQIVELRIPDEPRATAVAEAVGRIVGTQGGIVRISYGEPVSYGEPLSYGSVNLRPVPAPEGLAELGRDAGQWALLHPAAHDHPRAGGEHLVQGESNPLFRVRYAHARTRALRRNAADLGFAAAPGDLDLPEREESSTYPRHERQAVDELLAALADYPRTLAAAARRRAPDRLARHLIGTADAVLVHQHTVLPRGDEKPTAAHRARLALAEAAGTVLAGGLSLLGISAPEHL